MSTSLTGRVAVVTGAGGGLGRAEALELARHGAKVVVNDFAPDDAPNPAQAVADEIVAAGGEATAHRGDISRFDVGGELVALAVDTYGSLDILVNNAGLLRDRMLFSMTEAEWDIILAVHAKGTFNTSHHATKYWRDKSKAEGGPVYARVVNTASEACLAGSPGQANYAAAKYAVIALTMSTANGCARYGVRANAIAPRALTKLTSHVFTAKEGLADGELDPLAPEHVSPLVAYLAGPAADHISGQVFIAHGGFVAVLERPTVQAKFDAKGETFDTDELAKVLGAHFADKELNDGFSAVDLLRLRRTR